MNEYIVDHDRIRKSLEHNDDNYDDEVEINPLLDRKIAQNSYNELQDYESIKSVKNNF